MESDDLAKYARDPRNYVRELQVGETEQSVVAPQSAKQEPPKKTRK